MGKNIPDHNQYITYSATDFGLRCFLLQFSNSWRKSCGPRVPLIEIHYITIQCSTLHYITLHYITLHYITYIDIY